MKNGQKYAKITQKNRYYAMHSTYFIVLKNYQPIKNQKNFKKSIHF